MNAEPLHTSEDTRSSGTTMGAVMTALPRTIDPDVTCADAHALMREHRCRHLPVVHRGALMGVVSERDLYFHERLSAANGRYGLAWDAMTTHVFTTTAEAKVRDVAREMAAGKYECAVVTDGQRVVGIFTATDAFRHLADEHA